MSMKTYLAQKNFTETRIFGHPFTLERLIGWFLRALLADLSVPPRVIVGRPVRFAVSSSTMRLAPNGCAAPMPKRDGTMCGLH
jgi:hypothetical protein